MVRTGFGGNLLFESCLTGLRVDTRQKLKSYGKRGGEGGRNAVTDGRGGAIALGWVVGSKYRY